MGWSATVVAWATGLARSESQKHLHRSLLRAICAKREMAECHQNRDEVATYWWVHLWLRENTHSWQTTTEGNQSSTTIYQRAYRVSKESNDRQISDLWESKETSPSHCRNTEAPTLSLQEKEWYVDKHTRTTTEDALAYRPQETYKSYANLQRTEKAEKSVTSTMEDIEKRGKDVSIPLCGKPQYVIKLSNAAECYERNTGEQIESHHHRHHHAFNWWSLYSTRRAHA